MRSKKSREHRAENKLDIYFFYFIFLRHFIDDEWPSAVLPFYISPSSARVGRGVGEGVKQMRHCGQGKKE